MAPQAGLAAAALIVNALVWGLSWWPFRHLDGLGLHPLWATTVVYALSSAVLLAWRPRSLLELLRPSPLWVLVLAAGTTNAAFNWAVSIGDVVRVVLLFYLMPLWAVLLARVLLDEPITRQALLRVALGLLGAAVVLWPEGGAGQLSAAFSLADGLAILGGFSFALNNIMLRRERHRSEGARAAAMFIGGALVAAVVGWMLSRTGSVALPGPWGFDAPWWPLALLLALAFLVANLSLQYGASRLPASRSAVIMLMEVPFAAISAVLLGAGTLTPLLLIGAGCILASAWLSAFD